ncbi:hypothetical protein [Pontivivens ytuae]|uniref:Uncharacterized protein n=1 Tax=Pontivivens ytuae TaxID=2789856 RepID=A0A7S9QC40_9RHOB|nr:hypothetical protein [Pontivivens ytuae]QPH53528.1 hypothetical protein I0K15_17355 [Pontivivens ytuae]
MRAFLTALLVSASLTPALAETPVFDGDWRNPEFDYAIRIFGEIGIVTQADSAVFSQGDVVLRLPATEDECRDGRQRFGGGDWAEVRGCLVRFDTLLLETGTNQWVLRRTGG